MVLRQIPIGQRFVLLRTGEKYVRLVRCNISDTRIRVACECTGKETTLHHACHVKPIVVVK